MESPLSGGPSGLPPEKRTVILLIQDRQGHRFAIETAAGTRLHLPRGIMLTPLEIISSIPNNDGAEAMPCAGMASEAIQPTLHPTAWAILVVVAEAYPSAITHEEIGDRTDPKLSRTTVGRWLKKELRPRELTKPHPGGGEAVMPEGLRLARSRK